MKKFLSILLMLMLVMSMSVVAFAEKSYYESSDAGSFTISKTYVSSVQVTEKLSFTSECTDGPDKNKSLTIADVNINSETKNEDGSYTITVQYPSYDKAGNYKYTISEIAGTTAGVTYTTNTIAVEIVVGYDNDAKKLVVLNEDNKYAIKNEEGKKTEKFENTFSCGSFTVAKDVEGNMASETDKFEISVTLTSTKPIGTNVTLAGTTVIPSQWTTNYEEDGTTVKNYTYTSKLSYSESDGKKTFSNIPTGVVVTVSENTAEEKMNGYTYNGVFTRTKDEDGENVDSAFNSLTIASGTNGDIVVKNTKTTEITTGISMDSMPYILLMAVAFVGLVMLVSKKRTREF